jgi:hypothetical protein
MSVSSGVIDEVNNSMEQVHSREASQEISSFSQKPKDYYHAYESLPLIFVLQSILFL